jgi:hypothetical protein
MQTEDIFRLISDANTLQQDNVKKSYDNFSWLSGSELEKQTKKALRISNAFQNPSNVFVWFHVNDNFIIMNARKKSLLFPASRLKSVLFAFKLIEKYQQVYFGFENADTYKLFLDHY